MTKMFKSFFIYIAVIVTIVVVFFVFKTKNSVEEKGLIDLIEIDAPTSNELIKSPVKAHGKARGNWFFEASFPVKIYDANNKELGVGIAQAKGEWMTENFVPFEVSITFEKPSTNTGTIVFEKDNPSGLPEHSAEFRVLVRFDLTNWPIEPTPSVSPDNKLLQLSHTPTPVNNEKPTVLDGCRVTGCSGSICAEEEIITTCEYKTEYACYKKAECKKQEDGQCGWTPTEEIVSCLREAWESEGEPELQ